MSSAGTADVTDTPAVTLFSGDVCKGFYVYNDLASDGNALIHVTGLHAIGEFMPLPPGQGLPFRGRIETVTAKANTTATLHYGVIAR